MSRILLTLDLGVTSVDLAVPADLTLTDVVRWLVRFERWQYEPTATWLSLEDGTVLPRDAALSRIGLLDGMTVSVRSSTDRPSPPAEPELEPPQPIAVPLRLSTIDRLVATTRVLLGAGPNRDRRWSMAVDTWRWTDHSRRLTWIIGRPKLTETIVIGVSGHRSDELTRRLASAIEGVRPEPVRAVPIGDQDGVESLMRGTRRAGRPELIVVDRGRDDPGEAPIEACRVQTVFSTMTKPPRGPATVVVWWSGLPPDLADRTTNLPISERRAAALELAAALSGSWNDASEIAVGRRFSQG